MLVLVIGDKQLSSWSLRPWLLLRAFDLPFEEVRLPLDTERFRSEIERWSPNRRVPVLIDGSVRIWESIAICEYIDELVGGRAWPADAAARAHARAICAEMHAGFASLRRSWPMQAASRQLDVALPADAAADVARIDAIWTECRLRHREAGPWLYGAYSIADAMYAPVVLRFNSYGARLSATAGAYFEHALADPRLQEWVQGAARESRA